MRPELGACHRGVLEQGAELHDEGHLAGREQLADGHRRNEREGHEHVGLDVEARDEANRRLAQDGHAAQHDGDPRRFDGQPCVSMLSAAFLQAVSWWFSHGTALTPEEVAASFLRTCRVVEKRAA